MKNKFTILIGIIALFLWACKEKNSLPTIAFVDAFEDETIGKARKGFFDALEKAGYSEKNKTINVIYKNAQGSDITLNQIIQYCKSQKPTLIATCPTTPTIAALQQIKETPIFMMVAPKPSLMKLNNNNGEVPKNLLGVGEDIDYIDTSFALIPKVLNKPNIKVGMMFNQSETQSVDALNRIKEVSKKLNIEIIALPVNSSADVQLVVASLLSNKLDAFFANPDNVVFSGFEVILKKCNEAKVPIFTSEEGLVSRGALVAYGANIYSWGYQAGEQAVQFLKTNSTQNIQWQMVAKRRKVYNEKVAANFGFTFGDGFEAIQ